MYDQYNVNNDATNNSLLAVDAPPSYNNVYAFNSPQMNTQRGAQLPSYNEALVEQNTLQESELQEHMRLLQDLRPSRIRTYT